MRGFRVSLCRGAIVDKKRRRNKKTEVEVDVDELEGIIDASATGPLTAEQRDKLRTTLQLLIAQIDPKFRSSEKLDKLVKELLQTSDSPSEEKPGNEKSKDKNKGKRNGRTPAVKFTGAETRHVPHQSLKGGDQCPACPKGKVYPKPPEIHITFKGTTPIQATKYERERFRCNLCGETFTADLPPRVCKKRYDETVPSVLGLLIYGGGLPRSRLAGLQDKLGIPLAQSTQWELLDEAAEKLKPALEEMIKQAAQGDVLHSDDTSRKILKLERPENDTRTGVFTSGIISTGAEAPRIALFFTGRRHAGENLSDVLAHRDEGRAAPIAMHDAESKNVPKIDGVALKVELANCLPHGRRYFVDNFKNFPDECHYVLKELCEVFKNDRYTKQEEMTPQQRLEYHQAHSGPIMANLREWLDKQIKQNLAEPNSGLGKSINYLRNHWEKLTLFLRKPGAPLDNNLVERGLKKAILHRKNSLFYRTQRGADVGDLFTSIIHTCELNGINPFKYVSAALVNQKKLSEEPEKWMPWNYESAANSPQDVSES
jgi:hypothetical protein